MFFMTKADLAYLGQSAGWELGVGPSVVAVDAGMAKTLTTTTARAGIYAFIHLWSAGADGRPRPARIQDQQDRPVTTCEVSRPDAASIDPGSPQRRRLARQHRPCRHQLLLLRSVDLGVLEGQ